ncbi:MAG: cysteine synthase A [Lentisphaerae bacterium]|nr:cysteine synthase A [Lentisphaerota bacterium]
MEFYTNILNAIGETPLFELARLSDPPIFAKAEYMNPGGSIKDRVALYIIKQAEKQGLLKPGMTIIEATSGNTGIGLAFVGVHRGYRVLLVMPEDMSEERRKIIRAFGGELQFTPATKSLEGSIARVRELVAEDPDRYFYADQFHNPLNPQVHYVQTGPEIWRQMEGQVDAFVAGVGSGGTLGGVGRFLKEQKADTRVVAVEPANAAALLGHEPGLHKIQGIGDGFVPDVLDTALIDEVITVTDDDAVTTARRLAAVEGTLVGTSSGANVWAALKLSQRLGPGHNVVTVLTDRAERYFSTALI